MKKRLLTAAVGVPLLLILILLAPVWCVGVVLGIVSLGATYELMHCIFPEAPVHILISSMVSSFLLPFSFSIGFPIRWSIWIILLLFFIFSCELMLSFRRAKQVSFPMLAVAMMAGVVMPMMIGTLARMRWENGSVGKASVLLPFVIAFTSDGAAYFAGRAFGKHKLAPVISPNKTVEGSIAGIIAAALFCLIYGLVLILLGFHVNLLSLILFGVVGSVVSQLGDLTFSAIKRQAGIKDYGKLLPGHGGVLDRFDSMYYLAPLTEFWMLVVPAIWF